VRKRFALPDSLAGAGQTTMTVAYCGELVEQLADAIADLESAVDTAIRAARAPWWR
jgi:hypothetical protein